MGHFVREDIPFYHALADAFTIGDQYFCSIHGPTNPNRMFLFSGTSGLSVGDARAQAVDNVDDGNWTADMARDKADFPAVSRWTTYAERLENAGISWKLYQEYENFGDNSLAFFAQFRGSTRPPRSIAGGGPGSRDRALKPPRPRRPSIWLPPLPGMLPPTACRKSRGSSRPIAIPNIPKRPRPMANP
jgi:phospholipase C